MLDLKESFIKNYHLMTTKELLKVVDIIKKFSKYDKDKSVILANKESKEIFGAKAFEYKEDKCR